MLFRIKRSIIALSQLSFLLNSSIFCFLFFFFYRDLFRTKFLSTKDLIEKEENEKSLIYSIVIII